MSKYIRKYIILISVDLLYQFMIIMSSGDQCVDFISGICHTWSCDVISWSRIIARFTS